MKNTLRSLLLTAVTCLMWFNALSQKLSPEETSLYEAIMEYRASKGLSEIPLSRSLTEVAQTHCRDLVENQPDRGRCNGHSWSDKGKWSSCCYTPDHAKAECVWKKPSELTPYEGYGYEIACGDTECCLDFDMTAKYALESWQGSPGHNSVIVNLGSWNDNTWRAIGIGIYQCYAVVWFGEDPEY